MSQLASQPAFPSIDLLTFVVPLSLQALLLHPIFPSTLSRPLRFLLAGPAVYLSLVAPFRHGVEPRELSIGINFVLGVMSAYAAWKSLEWGLAKDLTPYTWIGFEEELVQRKEERKDGGAEGETHGKHYWHRMRDAKHLYALRSQAAANDGPIAILSSTFHLLTAMRGVGWAFGPSPRSRSRPLPRAPLPFLLRLLFELLWSHVVLVLACITLTSSSPTRTAFISSHLPSLSPSSTSLLSETLAGLSLGITAYAGLTAGYWTAVLPAFLLTTLARLLPSGIRPPPFDSRQYPPLFMAPWCPTSVSHFWRSSWHAFFTRPFRFLAFDPVDRILRAVGGKELGRVGGTIAVFAMSAWLHEQAIWSATIHLPPFDPPLSFVNRWGASIYFVLQGVAVVLEGAFAKLTGRRVSGPLGFLWALPWMGGLGALVYQSWTTLGLTSRLPEVGVWTWQRFVFPLACFAPVGIWTQ